jgi:CheY-like chemotaxis protein
MLIDDNEMDNFINQKIIEATSFASEIYTNTNGLSALEFLNNLNVKKEVLEEMLPDVIFVDLNMPLINGFQFIEKFYELPKEFVKNCKIVILTSSLNEEDRHMAHRLNPDIIFLNKPLTEESLSSVA